MTRKIFFYCVFFSFALNAFNVLYDGDDVEESFRTISINSRFDKDDYFKYFPNYRKYKEVNFFVDISQINIDSLPYPYNTLGQILSFNGNGSYVNSEFVERIFKNNDIVNAIEIGSDLGLSTRHIARLLPDNGKLYSIDIWTEYGPHYEPFLSNIVHCGLEKRIIPIRAYSAHAIYLIKLLNMQFDFIYVDGDHRTESVFNDLQLYFSLLSKVGVMAGDDWLLKSVRIAVIDFAKKYNLTIYADCNFFFLKKEGQFQIKSLLTATDQDYSFGSK
ncbi:class I SAM-dependent methyltransferase [Candidatus Dependentiae bacterium]|nr:class I SAM-dependent methyltransferase [Candidatus Dependentiae bacterium]